MRSLIIASSTLLLLVAAPVSAAQPVTTGETETDSGFPEFSVLIVSPAEGAVLEGTPDAVVPVTIEIESFLLNEVGLKVDDVDAGKCPDELPCTIEVTLTPGVHKLEAWGDDGTAFVDSHAIMIEVEDNGVATEGPTSSATDTDATDTDATTGSDTTGSDTTGSDTTGDSDSGGSSEKSGCDCSASSGGPDLLGLALLGLLVPWRRRRRA